MRSLAASLAAAADVARPPYNGMFISLAGTLTLSARALRDLAEPPDDANERALDEHRERCYGAQPLLHAHGLEELARHLEMVKRAAELGDLVKVRQFFEIYRLD